MVTQEWLDQLEQKIIAWGSWKHEVGYGLGCDGPLQLEYTEQDRTWNELKNHIAKARNELRLIEASTNALSEVGG